MICVLWQKKAGAQMKKIPRPGVKRPERGIFIFVRDHLRWLYRLPGVTPPVL